MLLLASDGERPGILLNILTATNSSLSKVLPGPNVSGAEGERPDGARACRLLGSFSECSLWSLVYLVPNG